MDYIPTIGIEVHVELNTNTKIFSPSPNTYGKSANTTINEIDLGYPGTLPNINMEVINLAIKACHLLHCNINKNMHFDRKNYFYPDNPKNYQITQNETPIGYDGYLDVEVDGIRKKIFIEEMHIEEDTCKSTHRSSKTYLDFNRAGVPLIEIVTKPCISSGEEAKAYLEKLKETLFYANISDCKMEEGSMRADVNVSIRKKETDPLGVKAEVKNIGSIRSVGIAVDSEIKRQIEAMNNKEELRPQTRRFDSNNNTTVLMRYKETGNDYRYFPEPDIPYIHLTDSMIKNAVDDLPIMPDDLKKIYISKNIKDSSIKKLIDNKELSDFFNQILDYDLDFNVGANILLEDIEEYLNKNNMSISSTKLTVDKFVSLINKKIDGSLTSKNIKNILSDIMELDLDVDSIIIKHDIKNISDDSYIEKIIDEIVVENPNIVEDYKSRPDRAIKFIIGQAMKKSCGQIDPKKTQELVNIKLNNM